MSQINFSFFQNQEEVIKGSSKYESGSKIELRALASKTPDYVNVSGDFQGNSPLKPEGDQFRCTVNEANSNRQLTLMAKVFEQKHANEEVSKYWVWVYQISE